MSDCPHSRRFLLGRGLLATLLSISCNSDSGASGSQEVTAWVTADRLHRRTCPSADCGSVGVHFFRQGVTVLEERDGWARITKPYDASCTGGRSEYVDSGNSACVESNGIVNGRFSEWVALRYLSDVRPADPAAGATGYHALITQSDDYRYYADVFADAAAKLLADGTCTRADFQEMGGFLKSSFHRDRPVYFTYCGGSTIANRLYLDASSGRVFR